MMSTRQRRAEGPSSAVAVETTTTKGEKPTWLWEAGGRLVETGQPATAEPTSASNAEEAEDEEWIVSSDDALPLVASNRPLPIYCPQFPKGGSRKEIAEWHRATRVAQELAKNDPVTHPPLLRETKGNFNISSSTCDELYSSSSRHREVVFGLARSIVTISSTWDDRLPEWNFNGIVIGPSESDEHARILTSSDTVCDYKGKLHKLLVRLPNKDIEDGELLFFDDYYGLAILEISIDMPLRCPSFVSSLDYGDEVFILTRNSDSLLITATGKVLWHNEPYLGRNHYLYLSCGLVMDGDGDIVGMTFCCGGEKAAVLPSLIIKKLIEMESNFRCIARPVHGLSLRAVQVLDMPRREEILYKHSIDIGYLVDEKSTPLQKSLGLGMGINGMCSQNMLKLEEYLLFLGWKFLERKIESSKIVLKVKVYDPLNCQENTLSLPLGFSCLTTVKERVKVQATEKTFASVAHDNKRMKTTPEHHS